MYGHISLCSSQNEKLFPSFREKTHILCSVTFLKNLAKYEKIWKSIVDRDMPQMTVWRMVISRWKPKTTYRPSEYVILKAFPLQQQSRERTPLLRYTHIACLVSYNFKS
jgi:hypothetical protein